MNAFVSIGLTLLSLILLLTETYAAGVIFAVLSFIVFAGEVKKQYGLNSIFFLFILFFGLYGYSVPISILFGLDIGWHKVAKFYYWDKIDSSLFSFLISNQIALSALVLANEALRKLNVLRTKQHSHKFSFFTLSILTALLTSIFEFINFARVGGFSAVKKGKAFYQSSVNDLVLNVPTEGYFYVALAFFTLSIVRNETSFKDWNRWFKFILSVSFFVLLNVLIGERGSLVFGMGVLFLGFTSQIKLKKFRFSLLIFLGIMYLLFNVMTILREPNKSFNGVQSFIEENGKLLSRLMNPANTEFGSAAFNYRVFISEDFEYRLGSSYIEGVLSPIPTYVYRNKPQSISYEYRDKFNSDRKAQGSIAGTGFSSLLEAYVNFGYFGPFVVYFFLGAVLVLLELYRNTGRLFVDVFYLISFSIFMIFSRSASSYLFLKLMFYLFQILSPLILYHLLFMGWKRSADDLEI